MNETIKLPRKYAVLELKEQGGWGENYRDITVGYIPSMCYLVETTTKYLSDGNTKVTSKVVFPYRNISQFKQNLRQGTEEIGEKEEPEYNYQGQVLNAEEVQYVFESYEEAEYLAEIYNGNIHAHLLDGISLSESDWKDKFRHKEEIFQENQTICKRFAGQVKLKTESVIEQLKLLKNKE